jgi:hypothetical protein
MAIILTKDLVEEAILMAEPSIVQALARKAKRNAGHLRVSAAIDGRWQLLGTRDFGDPDTWEHDYRGHATAKEAISRRTGKSTREVQQMYPELLEAGDTVYYGSVVGMNGKLVVSFSGVEAWFDELFAKWVLASIIALIQHDLELQRATGHERYEA